MGRTACTEPQCQYKDDLYLSSSSFQLGLEYTLQMHRSLEAYCATFFRRSNFRHQSVSLSVQPERPLVAKVGTTEAGDMAGIFCLKCRLPRYI